MRFRLTFLPLCDMLAFALTLLGGCVATTTKGQPSELYFPAHSVSPKRAASYHREPPFAATELSLKADQHRGFYIAENIQKTGVRSSYTCWGITSALENSPITGYLDYYTQTLCLSLCSKRASNETGHRTNVNFTSSRRLWTKIGAQPSLYTSGEALSSERFILDLYQGELRITDSFSGEERTTVVGIDGDVSVGSTTTSVCIWGTPSEITYDFVVSSYENPGLGAHQLTIPLRPLPAAFAESTMAVYEFQHNILIEL